jgi:hypothetical protein
MAFITIYGDTLEVAWDGNVWVSSCGAQFASESEAMKVELHEYLTESGEDVDYNELKLADHGNWEDV